MLFNSIEYLIFFPTVCALYFVLREVFKDSVKRNLCARILLLSASLFFYASWNIAYLALIIFSVIVTFFSGILMERYREKKNIVLFGSLFLNLSVLFFFKYYNFFVDSTSFVASNLGVLLVPHHLSFLLPVGISFYTFQALGYSVDVWRGDIKAEKSLLTYSLFVTFFPQLVAGPIERSSNLLPQFKNDSGFDYKRVTDGMKLIAFGLFKKIVVADTLAIYVDAVYLDVSSSTACALILATFFFSFQILCDFSGYTDIAIGCAKILGFNLKRNFLRPYFSKSIAEFWRRWHISLSSWLRDYVYIPLGGSRKGNIRRYFNLFIVFFLSGLWHGASWTFVIWGVIHGLYQIISLITKKPREILVQKLNIKEDSSLLKIWQVLVTFILVCFAWIFFRAETIKDAITVIQHFALLPSEIAMMFKGVLSGLSGIVNNVREVFMFTEATMFGFFKATRSFIYIAVLFSVDIKTRQRDGLTLVSSLSTVKRWILYFALATTIVYLSQREQANFIYFQF